MRKRHYKIDSYENRFNNLAYDRVLCGYIFTTTRLLVSTDIKEVTCRNCLSKLVLKDLNEDAWSVLQSLPY